MVLFEDKNKDGHITTESETSDPEALEVLQRHLYYPFGMNYEGVWNYALQPENAYQYKGANQIVAYAANLVPI